MIHIVKRYKFEILISLLLIVVYFVLRLTHIMNLPLFTDEAIYVRWSQIAKQDANWRFISLTDGKQPMLIWIAILFLHVFHDPLLGVRMVSVCAGFATVVGLFFLGKELFQNRWVGLMSSLLYVVYPFGLVYDRMAIYDSLVATFAVWGWYLSILLIRRIRPELSFILGLVLGGGFLTKSSDFFIAALLPLSVLLFNFTSPRKWQKLGIWAGYALLSVLLAYLYYSVVRLSPFYSIINEKNALFVYPFSLWIHHPFTYVHDNSMGLWDWFIRYMKLPFLLLIAGAFVYYKERLPEKIVLLAWFTIPFLYLIFFGKTLYPRFILFMTVALLPLAAYTIVKLTGYAKRIYWKILIVLVCIIVSLYTDFFVITDFTHAQIPYSDIDQYMNGWPAGGGVQEAVAFFNKQAETGKIYIGTEGTFGLMPYGLEIYLVNNPNIKIEGIWPINDMIPAQFVQASKKMPTYVLFYQPCPSCKYPGIAPETWPLKLVYRFNKPVGNVFLSVYQVNK